MKSFILTLSMGGYIDFYNSRFPKFQFDRLLKEIDRLIEEKQLNSEEVFAQIGYSTYEPCHYSYQKFLNKEEFLNSIDKSEIIVTHGEQDLLLME